MRRFSSALLALALLTSSPFAQSSDTVVLGPLQVRIECPWPSSVTKGYQPVDFTVISAGEEPATLELILDAGYNNALRVQRTVVVGGLETLSFEMLMPAYISNGRAFRVEATAGGDSGTSNTLGQTGAEMAYGHDVAVFSAGPTEAGRGARWSTALSPAPSGSGPTYWGARWRNLGFDNHADWEAKATVSVVDVPFASMSPDWRAYTSLDFAVVDLGAGAPARGELEALLAWVRTGGEVAFASDQVNVELAKLDALAPWLEDRFLLEPVDGVPRVRRYQCGFGRILVAPMGKLLDDAGLAKSIVEELRSRVRTEWTPSPRASRGRGIGLAPEIPGLGRLPYRVFIVLMLLFGILVWPVNFFLVRRSGQPVRLLITIPAIAIGASLLALAYGLLWQGVDIKTQSTTVAVLDQRTGIAENAEARAIYAGLAPGRGLVPGAGTAVFPWGQVGDWSQGTNLRIDYRDGEERYGGDFLPSRTQIQQALVSNRATRLRVEIGADGQLTNGLGVELQDLIAHAPDGGWWQLDGSLPAGQTGQIVEIAEPPSNFAELTPFNQIRDWTLPRGTYSAKTKSAALRDAAGLELVEVAGDHSVLGVLERDAVFPKATR